MTNVRATGNNDNCKRNNIARNDNQINRQGARPWRSSRRRIDDEATHQQGGHRRILPHPTTEESAIHSRGGDHCQSRVSLHSEQATDYCNTVLANPPVSTIAPIIQRVQNAVARLIKGLRPRDHITSHQHYETHTGCLLGSYRVHCVLMHPVHADIAFVWSHDGHSEDQLPRTAHHPTQVRRTCRTQSLECAGCVPNFRT